jgi:hypothetical protein
MRTLQFMSFLGVSALIVGCGISSTPTKSLTGTASDAVAAAQRQALGLGDMAVYESNDLPALQAISFTGPLIGEVSTSTQNFITSIPFLDTVGTITSGTWQGTAISDSYLATISTAGKVSNSATTASSANTFSAIVARDASGNFSAGTITANITGNVSGSAASFTGSLAGDVTGPQGTTVVSTVGTVSAANIASGANAANAATDANTASTIVKRDTTGNFSAGTITANITGNVSGSAASFTGSLAGDVTGPQGTTVVSTVGTVSAANIASGANAANAATDANTASTIVKRDASGNFSAGTADLTSLKLTKNSSEPVTCSSGIDGRIALTSLYRLCVCNGATWVETSDGSTACSW